MITDLLRSAIVSAKSDVHRYRECLRKNAIISRTYSDRIAEWVELSRQS